LDKMSFAFAVPEGGQSWVGSQADGLDLREITDTILYDVSIVTEPAYGGTDIALRSRDAANAKGDDEKREAEKARAAYAARKAEQEQKFRKI
jgi:uncharacterized protein